MTRATARCIMRRINEHQVTLPGVQSAQVAWWEPAVYGVLLRGQQGQPVAILTEVAHYQALANHVLEPA